MSLIYNKIISLSLIRLFAPYRNILTFILLQILSTATNAQYCNLDTSKYLFFNYLSVNNGLSQNSVTSILQDSNGFIWVGTYDGLNRYDGYSTQIKRHIYNDNNSLTDNRILCLSEDDQKNILIGTQGGGLNIFNTTEDKFHHLSIEEGSLQNNVVQTVCTDTRGNIWIGTENGLAIKEKVLHPNSKNTILYPEALKNKAITKLIRDQDGNVWIGTNQGLFFSKNIDATSVRISKITRLKGINNSAIGTIYQDKLGNIWIGLTGELFKISYKSIGSLDSEVIESVYNRFFTKSEGTVAITEISQDLNRHLWISSQNKGIFEYITDEKGQVFMSRQYNTQQPFCNMSENMISTFFIDQSNILWIGTFHNGINYSNLSQKNFYAFHPLMTDNLGEFGYKGQYITSVVNNNNELWVGSANNGLYSFNKCTKQLDNYLDKIGSNEIISIYLGKDSTVWIGGNNGLYKAPYQKNNGNNDGKRVIQQIKSGFTARSLCEDKLDNLFIATWNGILIYDKNKRSFSEITTKEGLSSNTIYSVYEDPYTNVIWAGTIGGGLNRIEYSKKENQYKITNYRHNKTAKYNLSSNHIWCIYRGSNQFLWLGTDAGLNKVILDDKANITAIEHINNPQLKDKKIVAILEDKNNNLWLSSSQGLYRYNFLSDKVKRFTFRDGLQSNTLTEGAFQDKNGWLYFGGINGLNYFKPENIIDNPYLAKIAITDLKIFNQSIAVGQKINQNVLLKEDINATSQVTLTYLQNNFLFTFAALHYALPEDNKFKYKLEGYDKNWQITNYNQAFAAYSNLDAGKYKFIVSASNNDEQWSNQIKTIEITVLPAPWNTWWAKTFYIFFLGGIAWFVINYYHTKHQLKHELALEKLEQEKNSELTELKLNFFTNITHEIRTPLNLIIGPLQDLVDKAISYDYFTQFRLEIIHRNSLRLFSLINQILDLRKISSETQKLIISQNNLVQTINSIKISFDWMAKQKGIVYKFNYPSIEVIAWFDIDKIEKIVFNLLSNAFKYTPDNGHITITLTAINSAQHLKWAQITVTDSGEGIDKAEQDKIFDLFYRGKAQDKLGTGIGLSLTKKLIEMHKGTISVESAEGNDTKFIISFPITLKCFDPEDIYQNINQSIFYNDSGSENTAYHTPHNKAFSDSNEKVLDTVLLIEDNDDQRAYIKECIREQYHVLEAKDGINGFKYTIKYQPDIIVTDLLMPFMDGIELCKKIKDDVRTKHIPVIIHSIKNDGSIFKEAMQSGADDFIAKPFDYSMLLLKINNILKSRKKLLANAYKDIITRPSVVEVPSEDEELLKTILEIVEQHISDEGFNVEQLCRLAYMNRMTLHRKLHEITGKTTSEFIREIRLKRAGQLLSSGSKRISEVMNEVGISSNTLFNKYFKEMYGLLPKEFMKQAKNNDLE